MKNLHKFASWAAVLALAALPAWGLDTKVLKPTGYVNDFSGQLDASSKQTLEAYCANLERVPACKWRSSWCRRSMASP